MIAALITVDSALERIERWGNVIVIVWLRYVVGHNSLRSVSKALLNLMVSGAVSGWVNIPTRISAFPTQQSVSLIFSRSHHIKIAEEKSKDRVI